MLLGNEKLTYCFIFRDDKVKRDPILIHYSEFLENRQNLLIFKKPKKAISIHHLLEKQGKTYERTMHHNHIETLSSLVVALDTDLTGGLPDDN
ncbi:hypothetical protein CEXT_405251 [Caerostris extrusa]|uniref:Uncharacterized protein n=1 Tax=Caerostris extrusa TaxID=172846 RepID=A0AAV4N953_CAEEX|nr:hypothetical protein CEXT_405251 [Caerostris extrusa]